MSKACTRAVLTEVRIIHAQFCRYACGRYAPGKLLPSPKDAVADANTSAVWLVKFSCATVTRSLKEAAAEPIRAVNSSNKTGHVLVCAVHNN